MKSKSAPGRSASSRVASGMIVCVSACLFAVAGTLIASRPAGVNASVQQPATPAPIPAQQPQVPQPKTSSAGIPTLKITTREVLLDVLVTDAAGHPVTGLKQGDFSIQEENTPQAIRSLLERTAMSTADLAKADSAPKLPPNTFTNFTPIVNTNASSVILLDALDTPVNAQMYLREQLIGYLKNMQPGASIAIFQLDSEMHLIQGFSSDPEVLLEAAKSKRNMPSLAGPNEFRGVGDRDQYRRIKREILRDGMQMMGKYLAGFPGRKNLIWFTGEVPLTISGAGLGSPFKDNFMVSDGDISDIADILTVSRVAVYPIDSRGLQTDPDFDLSKRHSSSGGNGFAARVEFEHSQLDTVAEATGGKAYYNSNGLKGIIAQIVDNGSNYYTLAYNTSNHDWNGQYRHIKITVDRPGVSLQYRRGYYAVNREQQEARQMAALQKRRAKAGNQPQDPTAPNAQDQPGGEQAGQQPDGAQAQAQGETGEMIHPAKSGLAASMALGAVPPTEIIFKASLAPDDQIAKLDKKATLPPGNFMRPQYLGKPFRTYSILTTADLRPVKLTQTPDGVRHGTVEFVAVVYGNSGEIVNSLLSTASLDVDSSTYRKLLQSGMALKQQIAIPVKGNYSEARRPRCGRRPGGCARDSSRPGQAGCRRRGPKPLSRSSGRISAIAATQSPVNKCDL